MQIFLIEQRQDSGILAYERLEEAIRQAGIRRMQVVVGDIGLLRRRAENISYQSSDPFAIFIGPTCVEKIEETVARARAVFPKVPLAAIVDNDTYALEAVRLRRLIDVRIMPVADIAQMANFVLDCESDTGAKLGLRTKGVISVCQLKGGVGCSTIAVGLAACWARNGLSVALIDLDDLNPQVTDWARVSNVHRQAVAEMLSQGVVPAYRLTELLGVVEGYDARLVAMGQPENYYQGFHFKADILEDAPSSSEFISSIIQVLQNEFDVVVIDGGRSWGISSFASLAPSQHTLLVIDDDGMSLRRSLLNLRRLRRESDDPKEFDLNRWSVLLNAYTGKLLTISDVSEEIEDLGIFPDTSHLYTIPFSETGRQWGGPGESFYELADRQAKFALEEVAFSLVPFRREMNVSSNGIVDRFQSLTGLALGRK